ncbi:MAG: IS5 family transposase, partial [Oscillospiraceae bacterium]|nr:IS5 family transposase [Oscillospiraceae bacterium]
MSYQMSIADIEYENRKRKTKRDEFLEIMEEVTPWDEIVEMIAPFYPSGKRGRPTRGIETMFRMYLLQNWFNLSDEGVEDAIYDSYAFRKFMKVDFVGEEQVPDATTLCKFRKLLDENGITKMFFDSVTQFLDKHGKLMHGGTIVDATIVEAPSSTKNAEKQRDPEMHQVKKGNEWHFGERLHVGVDAGTGYIHSMDVTAANVNERDAVPRLIRPDDEVLYGDAGYVGIEKRDTFKNDAHLSKIDYRINKRRHEHIKRWKSGPGIFWFKYLEYQKSRIRSKVEYVFFVIKRIFRYNKTKYRGLHKNRTQAYALCASANLYMLAKSG